MPVKQIVPSPNKLTLFVATKKRGFYPYAHYLTHDLDYVRNEGQSLNADAFYIKDARGIIVYNSEEN